MKALVNLNDTQESIQEDTGVDEDGAPTGQAQGKPKRLKWGGKIMEGVRGVELFSNPSVQTVNAHQTSQENGQVF